MKIKVTPGRIVAAIGLLFTVLGTTAAFLTVPEFRAALGLQSAEDREDRIKVFLLRYLASSDTTRILPSRSPKEISEYFRFPINNYYGKRNISNEALEAEVDAYHRKWISRSFTILEEPNVVDVENTSEGTQCLVQCSFAYELIPSDATKIPQKGVRYLRIEVLFSKDRKMHILSVSEFQPDSPKNSA